MAYFQFLGTGPSTPITDATGRNYRRRSSAIVQHISTYVLIDATHDFDAQIDHALSVTGVVITNPSRDAAGGLGNVDRWLSTETPLYATPALWAELDKRYGPFKQLVHVPLEDQVTKAVQDLELTAVRVGAPTVEDGPPTYAYHFNNGKKRICYASDFKTLPDAALPYFKDNDLLVVDAAGWDKDLPTHRGALNHLSDYVGWNNARILFTDVGRAAPAHTVASSAVRRMSHLADVAFDFMKLPLGR